MVREAGWGTYLACVLKDDELQVGVGDLRATYSFQLRHTR